MILIGVGNTVGSGIFILIGVAVHAAGPAVVLCLLFAGAATMCSALCYAEFAARFPVVGSAYSFTYLEAGELLAWNTGWALVFEWTVAFSAIALGWSEYMRSFVKGLGYPVPSYLSTVDFGEHITVDIPGVVFMFVLSGALCCGISEAKWLSHSATICKLFALVMVIVLGFWRADADNWSDFMPNGVSGLLAGAGSVMIAYLGFDTVCNAAEEAINPSHTVPAGIVGTVVIAGSIYILVGAALTLMVPWHSVDLKAPLAAAFANWLPWMVPVIAFAAVVGLFAIGLGCILTSSRLVLTLARDGLIPRGLATLSEQTQAPVISTLTVAVVALVLSLFCTFKTLIAMISIATIGSLSMVCLSLVLARKRDPEGGNKLAGLLILFVILCFSVMALHDAALPTAAYCAGFCMVGVLIWIVMMPDVFVPKDTFAAPAGPAVALLGTFMNAVMMWSLEVQGRWVTGWLVFGNIWYLVYGQHNSSLAKVDETTALSQEA